MTERAAYRQAEAVKVGREIIALLEPHCVRVMMCGSVRREKRYVHDVEILFQPKLVEGAVHDLFDPPEPVYATDAVIQKMINVGGILLQRLTADGRYTWGPLNKLGVHRTTEIPVDLFCEPSGADWWRSVVIRTGGKESNIRLIESAAKNGIRMHAYGNGFTRTVSGEVVQCWSEKDVFALCGVPWLEPKDRTA